MLRVEGLLSVFVFLWWIVLLLMFKCLQNVCGDRIVIVIALLAVTEDVFQDADERLVLVIFLFLGRLLSQVVSVDCSSSTRLLRSSLFLLVACDPPPLPMKCRQLCSVWMFSPAVASVFCLMSCSSVGLAPVCGVPCASLASFCHTVSVLAL